MEMVHHQDVTVELSTRLLAAQCEIETPHPAMKCRCHHPTLYEDGEPPLPIQHRHLVSHLLDLGFRQGAHSGQSLSLQISYSLGVPEVMSRIISCVMCDVLFHACECLM
jgi:hypothetical protein